MSLAGMTPMLQLPTSTSTTPQWMQRLSSSSGSLNLQTTFWQPSLTPAFPMNALSTMLRCVGCLMSGQRNGFPYRISKLEWLRPLRLWLLIMLGSWVALRLQVANLLEDGLAPSGRTGKFVLANLDPAMKCRLMKFRRRQGHGLKKN